MAVTTTATTTSPHRMMDGRRIESNISSDNKATTYHHHLYQEEGGGQNQVLYSRDSISSEKNGTRNSTSSDNDNENVNDILHIVTTRYMQHQSDLIALGQARLHLFETFCFPSMINQLTKNFLWFIYTDPNLDDILLQRLIKILSPYPTFYLILSNTVFDSLEYIISSANNNTDKAILTGDIELLRTVLYDTERRHLLETRLDADDGLHRKALLDIQQKAKYVLPANTTGWQVICNKLHFEWRNDNITLTNTTIDTSGKLRLVQESICVTPGFTLVKHREPNSIEFPPHPKIQHHLIRRNWPKCLGEVSRATSNCWMKLSNYPAALRSRTVTSAGMSRILTSPEESIYDNQTEIFWNFVKKDYGILPEIVMETSQFLQSNLDHIVEDNLKGQWYVVLYEYIFFV